MIYEWFCEFTREVQVIILTLTSLVFFFVFKHYGTLIQVNLLAYDYEGYGKASGTPSESSCYEGMYLS